ncbi:MAG TPA: decaprenyl-phosphate phosphoribosyltransferase [Ignavibacteriaceae bacterium]|nr:decaprenyl-phosphate phosphoribosyltransferase [Ignavibacteriaceae bacterium]
MKIYLKLFRVSQWIKNFFVFVPLLFSLHLFEEDFFITAFRAFIAFCLASSFVYVINDIVDQDADRAHPEKKNRPIASGKVSVSTALFLAALLLVFIILLMFSFNLTFNIAVIGFLLLNILYSFWFKHIVILDVFSIAAGFALRVLGGAFAIDVEISSWLILTTMFISLFLGVMKRHSELSIAPDEGNSTTRKVLQYYSIDFANQMATVAAAGVIICYALYSVANRTITVFGTENLIYTTPFVVFGIFRYMYLVYKFDKGENTTRIMVTDIPMIVTIISDIIVTVLIIYKVF